MLPPLIIDAFAAFSPFHCLDAFLFAIPWLSSISLLPLLLAYDIDAFIIFFHAASLLPFSLRAAMPMLLSRHDAMPYAIFAAYAFSLDYIRYRCERVARHSTAYSYAFLMPYFSLMLRLMPRFHAAMPRCCRRYFIRCLPLLILRAATPYTLLMPAIALLAIPYRYCFVLMPP